MSIKADGARVDGTAASRRSEPAPDLAAGAVTPGAVAEFLTRHPDFLNAHPELVETLTPPSERSGRRVLDMQRHMIERLQRSVRDGKARETDLLSMARGNRSSAARVHAAVLALCECGALDNLAEIISSDLPALLETDVVVLAIEAAELRATSPPSALPSAPGICLMAAGAIDRLMGAGRDVVLACESDAAAGLFGGAATLVQSFALLRLRLERPGRPALLALGSRDKERFQPGQGTETLAFLAEALGRRLREWLHYAL